MRVYQKTKTARRNSSRRDQQESKSSFKLIERLLADSNRQVQLCPQHNEGAGLEAKQLKKIAWRVKTVSDA